MFDADTQGLHLCRAIALQHPSKCVLLELQHRSPPRDLSLLQLIPDGDTRCLL